jgi:hypothetical protein
MKRANREEARARKIVTDRLRVFLAALRDQLSSGTDAFWKQVEERWNKAQSKKETGERHPPG